MTLGMMRMCRAGGATIGRCCRRRTSRTSCDVVPFMFLSFLIPLFLRRGALVEGELDGGVLAGEDRDRVRAGVLSGRVGREVG